MCQQQHQNILQKYPDHFDRFFSMVKGDLPPDKYTQLKKHILQNNESLMNLNWYMCEELQLKRDTRMMILDLVKSYEFEDEC